MKDKTMLLLVLLSLAFILQMAVAQNVDDPRLWLEAVDGEKALGWVKAKNAETVNALQAHPDFPAIYQKNLDIYNSKERIAYPNIVGDYVYNFWKDETNERGLWRRASLKAYVAGEPVWETVLDIDALSEKENQKWVYKGVSWLEPHGKRCLVSLSPGGGDAVEIREFDAERKVFVKDGFFLPKAKTTADWVDENTLIVGTDMGEGSMSHSGYAITSRIWKRGTDLSEAEVVYTGKAEDMGVWSYVLDTPERSYTIVARMITFYSREIFVMEGGQLIKLDIPEDAAFQGFFKNQLLVNLKSDWDIGGRVLKQGSLISIDYDGFKKGDRDFTVVVAPDARSSITAVSNTKNQLLVNQLVNVRSTLFSYTFDNGQWRQKPVDAPSMGTLGVKSAHSRSDQYFFWYEDFLTPTTLFYVSDMKSEARKIRSLPAFFDGERFEIVQNEAVSKDGTPIPYFLVHAKGLKPDGTNPTLLYGYGGFEVSEQPHYSASIGANWLERGGVYAVANIRGGGEFGPAWHRAGLKENRQRVYDDFIAVAEDLIARKITAPEHLGVWGGSNGGLLVGVMFTQRPDLFSAALCEVPLLDMKRYNKLLAGASWMGEYGNPDIPEEWAYIKKYSPYHNFDKTKTYPKVFFTTSTRDDRVHPGHARKMARLMEEAGKPFYYFENIEGGHGGVSTNDQRAKKTALLFVYALEDLK